jgi:hypothetical protein
MLPGYWIKARNYYRRNIARGLFRRPFTVRPQVPLISFTFDDFPRSALLAGGAILNGHDLAGTYYTALGLLGTEGPSGPLYTLDDLKGLIAQGHELGCHTFSHCHSWDTETSRFEESIVRNSGALSTLVPGAQFKSLSYPIAEPRPLTKRAAGRHFECCRAGGQTINAGVVDLNQLSAFFLEKSRDHIQVVRDLIDRNRDARGWLILATHDVVDNPSPYGCPPQFFADVVKYAIESGAAILPVAKALKLLNQAKPSQ